ncbi:MAG: hypothetical protein ABJH98_17985 [Reichenbachiella sp.]|uniref:hypothetical protein n=1 Tax=Reichenbachiella sp. TaxID=2184521 RepID=UPI00329A0622
MNVKGIIRLGVVLIAIFALYKVIPEMIDDNVNQSDMIVEKGIVLELKMIEKESGTFIWKTSYTVPTAMVNIGGSVETITNSKILAKLKVQDTAWFKYRTEDIANMNLNLKSFYDVAKEKKMLKSDSLLIAQADEKFETRIAPIDGFFYKLIAVGMLLTVLLIGYRVMNPMY